jgi:hypothetical protein
MRRHPKCQQQLLMPRLHVAGRLLLSGMTNAALHCCMYCCRNLWQLRAATLLLKFSLSVEGKR